MGRLNQTTSGGDPVPEKLRGMSISLKLTIWVVSVILFLSLSASYLYYRFEMNDEAEILDLIGSTTNPIIEGIIDDAMLSGDHRKINGILNNIRKIESITRIWVLDRDGTIRASSDRNDIGMRLASYDQRCQRCHDQAKRGIFLEGRKLFRTVLPVANRPQCYGCHDPVVAYNGVILADFPLSRLETHVKRDINHVLLIFIPSLMMLGIVMYLLSKRMIIKRLNNINTHFDSLKEGHYHVKIPEQGSDEITDIEKNFNRMAVAIDTRDRERDELFRKVSHAKTEWQETFDSITDMISIHDKDFNILRANRAFAESFGLHPRDVIHRKCYDVVHGTDAPVVNCPHLTTCTEMRPVWEEVIDPKTNKILRVSTYPYYSPEREFIGSIHVARDITSEKEKERLSIMNERLAFLGQLASSIAHEVNNPLASIAICTESLLSRVKKGRFDTGLFESYLKIMEEEVRRSKSITSNMLSFVRKTVYEKKNVDIKHILEQSLEIIGFQGRLEGITLVKNYAKSMPSVLASEGELKQVFLIIITNALDAMTTRGTLTITTGMEGDRASIRIADTGAGIPSDNIKNIFKPFFTTKSEKGGIGLGLSIVHKIITNHDGTIDVFSEVGKGSSFKITLPV